MAIASIPLPTVRINRLANRTHRLLLKLDAPPHGRMLTMHRAPLALRAFAPSEVAIELTQLIGHSVRKGRAVQGRSKLNGSHRAGHRLCLRFRIQALCVMLVHK